MARKIILIISLLSAASLALALVSPPPPAIRSLSHHSDAFRLSAINNNNRNNDDLNVKDQSSKPTLSRRLFGLAFPFAVAIAANAPFLYVIAKPPSAEERDVMLMDFCKGDTCTLLGGGSGFGGGDIGGEAIAVEIAQAMPSVEDFEAMARTAAEAAMSAGDVL
mmetsp:Transcript_4602/g.10389  ORF Transcript_4602/g.10389 Transcript_4602/m.10389 type:complete len:164 (+) Transcript_4602:136-627(+)|eukprot:CAMPEP_0172318876 /NCGR_PEP_ID=MMETSP1058-20130122/36090_1 /TAXON_ID=83371 /ORGANISM="Detonula confervacea, Strain CCMP 353" /LENGTH=163 /DNA_ID=CAMNT_0013033797 /DNA_START=112 /DNA_END=603 /DNA_ORIENTATION=+